MKRGYKLKFNFFILHLYYNIIFDISQVFYNFFYYFYTIFSLIFIVLIYFSLASEMEYKINHFKMF